MSKYHVNPKTGTTGECHALYDCPFGDITEHYDSIPEAREAYERKMAAEELAKPLRKVDPIEAQYVSITIDKLDALGLEGWTVEVVDEIPEWSKDTVGLADDSHNKILLKRSHLLGASQEAVMDTVLHETAHAWVGGVHGHNSTWKAAAKMLGVKNPLRHGYSDDLKAKIDSGEVLVSDLEPGNPGYAYATARNKMFGISQFAEQNLSKEERAARAAARLAKFIECLKKRHISQCGFEFEKRNKPVEWLLVVFNEGKLTGKPEDAGLLGSDGVEQPAA